MTVISGIITRDKLREDKNSVRCCGLIVNALGRAKLLTFINLDVFQSTDGSVCRLGLSRLTVGVRAQLQIRNVAVR